MQDCVTQRSLANALITHLPMGMGHDLLHPCWSKVSHIVTTFKLYKIFCCLSFSYTEVLPLPYPCLFIHSIIYLYQDGLRYTYFTLWFISQYYINSLRQLFQFWPSGVVSVWLHVPVKCLHPLVFRILTHFLVLQDVQGSLELALSVFQIQSQPFL